MAVIAERRPVSYYSTMEATKTTCSDFADGHFFTELSWTFGDCIKVWTAFHQNLPRGLVIRPPHVDLWKTTADELRLAGKPCSMLTSVLNMYSNTYGVGVGSTTMKHFATWILAEEIGCDWVTPSWTSFNTANKNETTAYCHWLKDKASRNASSALERPCVSVNWLAYFNFGVPSTDVPKEIILKDVTVS